MSTIKKSITASFGKKIVFELIPRFCTVQEVEKWNELQSTSQTTSSGGGGFVFQGTGFVDKVRTHTSTSTYSIRHSRVYYDDGSGKTKTITFPNRDVKIIRGQKVVLCYVCYKECMYLSTFKNVNSGEVINLISSEKILNNILAIHNISNLASPIFILLFSAICIYRWAFFQKYVHWLTSVPFWLIWGPVTIYAAFASFASIIKLVFNFNRLLSHNDFDRAEKNIATSIEQVLDSVEFGTIAVL